MISVKGLTKKYNDNVIALENISFELNEGEICGYIGVNGAGKSTTAKILCGILDFNEGEVIVNGFNVKKDQYLIKQITGYIPENANLFNSLTTFEILDFISKIRNLDEKTSKKRILYFTELFRLSDELDKHIGNLSKGNVQKILIISALIHNPEIILLDEPLNGLDASSIIIFEDIINKLSQKGKTILYCSHLLNFVEKISNRIIHINKGKILFNKTINELKNSADFTSLENFFIKQSNDSYLTKFDFDEAYN